MILFLLIGAFVFSAFLAVSRMPFIVSESISGLSVHPYIILILILLVYIILGMFLDVMSIIVLTIPILLPTIIELDFNLIWYGVLLVRVAEMGFVSPPFGLNIFALAGAVDVPINQLYKGIYPFILADIINISILIAFPIISTFLPSMRSSSLWQLTHSPSPSSLRISFPTRPCLKWHCSQSPSLRTS